MAEILSKMEPMTRLPLVQRMAAVFASLKSEKEHAVSVDQKCAAIFQKLKPGI